MTKKILWASLALVVAFASCKKDDPNNNGSTPTEELKLTASTDAEKVQQIDKIVLTASGSRVTAAPDQVAWLVNGKQVAKGAKYTFIPPLPGNYTVIYELVIVRSHASTLWQSPALQREPSCSTKGVARTM